MKKAFKYSIAVIIVVLAFSSCVPRYPCDTVGKYYAGNETDNEIAIIFISFPEFKVHIQSDKCISDTITYLSSYERRMTKFRFTGSAPQDSLLTLYRHVHDQMLCRNSSEPFIEVWTIYNLNDTTSIKKGIVGGGVVCFRDSEIDKFVEVFCEINDDETHWTYKLTVNDSLLSLMEKDTSMLSLFPEYYGNNHTNPQK